MKAIEFVPNKITPEYWQQPKVRAWAEPLLNEIDSQIWAASDKGFPGWISYGENIISVLIDEEELDFESRFHPDWFNGDPLRLKAVLIAVGYNGLNPKAQNYDELWTRKQIKQEAA